MKDNLLPPNRKLMRAVSFEEVGEALARLFPIALPPSRAAETGASVKVADFLLAWWNGPDCGDFPILHLCNVDPEIAEDMLIVMGYLVQNNTVYVDAWGYRDAMHELWMRYRPASS